MEAASSSDREPRRRYVPGHGVLALWIDEEDRDKLCAMLEPTRKLPKWAQDGWEHVGACECRFCASECRLFASKCRLIGPECRFAALEC
jgi:hypothetical protein